MAANLTDCLSRTRSLLFFANSTCIRSSAIADLSSLDSARSRISLACSDSPSGASGFFPDSAASRATFTHLPKAISVDADVTGDLSDRAAAVKDEKGI